MTEVENGAELGAGIILVHMSDEEREQYMDELRTVKYEHALALRELYRVRERYMKLLWSVGNNYENIAHTINMPKGTVEDTIRRLIRSGELERHPKLPTETERKKKLREFDVESYRQLYGETEKEKLRRERLSDLHEPGKYDLKELAEKWGVAEISVYNWCKYNGVLHRVRGYSKIKKVKK